MVTMMTKSDARAQLLDLISGRDARRWRRSAGRVEIAAPHIPLGWVDLALTPVLNELVRDGLVKIVTLTPRAAGRQVPASFIVKIVK